MRPHRDKVQSEKKEKQGPEPAVLKQQHWEGSYEVAGEEEARKENIRGQRRRECQQSQRLRKSGKAKRDGDNPPFPATSAKGFQSSTGSSTQ